MSTRTITGTILNAAGDPIANAPVSFSMIDRVYLLDPDETYVASAVSTRTDSNGDFSVEVAAGLPTLWQVKLPGNDNFVISIPEGLETTIEELRSIYNGTVPERVPGPPPTVTDFTNMQHAHLAAATGGTLTAAAIASGILDTARLGSGTADEHAWLRGDQTWAAKLRTFDVTEFGTLVADDQDAATANRTIFQAAIDYVGGLTEGGRLIIPGDTFYLTGTAGQQCLIMRDGVIIEGTNRFRTVLKLKDGAHAHLFGAFSNSLDHAGLMDLTLDGNKANQDETIHVSGCRNVGGTGLIFSRLIIENCTHYGLSFTGGDEDNALTESVIEDCIIRNNGHVSELGDGIDCKAAQRSTFRDLWLYGNAETGMDMRVQHCIISGVRAYDNGYSGIQIRGGSTDPKMVPNLMTLTDCYSWENGLNGFTVSSDEGSHNIDRTRVEITNCHAFDNTTGGFYFVGRDGDIALTNCNAQENGTWGYYADTTDTDALRLSLVNCRAAENGSGGFSEAAGAGAKGPRIFASTFESNTGPGIQTNTPYAIIEGNRIESNTDDAVILNTVASNAKIANNQILSVPSGKYGVEVNANRAQVNGNTFSGVGTGVRLAEDVSLPRVFNNDFGAITTPVSDAGSRAARFRDNEGYITEARGTSVIDDAGTVLHGLTGTPTHYGAIGSTGGQIVCITGVSSTQLTFAIKDNDGTAGDPQAVSWYADLQDYGAPLWLPGDIGATVQVWLDPTTQTGFTDGASVGTWTDRSGNGRNAVEVTNQPTYQTNEQNGLPIIRFDGTDDTMLVSSIPTSAQPVLWLWVGKQNDNAGRWLSSANLYTNISNTGGVDAQMNGGSGVTYSTGGVADGTWAIHCVYFNGANSWGSLNGTRSGLLSAGTNASSSTMRLAASAAGANHLVVDFGDIIIVHGAVSDADVYRLEGWAHWKWGLQANLPGGHAYAAAPPLLS